MLLLIREMATLNSEAGGGKHPNIRTLAVIVLTSYAAEIALKTLHSLTEPYAPARSLFVRSVR